MLSKLLKTIEFATKSMTVNAHFPENSAQNQMFGTDNLLTANGEDWKRQRKVNISSLSLKIYMNDRC